jgi:hypothetical protein
MSIWCLSSGPHGLTVAEVRCPSPALPRLYSRQPVAYADNLEIVNRGMVCRGGAGRLPCWPGVPCSLGHERVSDICHMSLRSTDAMCTMGCTITICSSVGAKTGLVASPVVALRDHDSSSCMEGHLSRLLDWLFEAELQRRRSPHTPKPDKDHSIAGASPRWHRQPSDDHGQYVSHLSVRVSCCQTVVQLFNLWALDRDMRLARRCKGCDDG